MKRDITLKLDARKSDKFEITSQGFLVVDAHLTRAGVFDYHEDGKLVRELRSPEEVFRQESLDSLKFAPLTKFHPKEMVDSGNIKSVQVGSIGENIFKRGDFAAGKVIVTDKKEIEEILDKWDRGEDIELSMGYDAEVVEVSGDHHKDGHYDKMQTNIIYNHGSIVPRGRAGREVKLIMDAEEEASKLNSKQKTEEKKMHKIKRDSVKIGSFKMDSVMEEVEDSAKGTVDILEGHLDSAIDTIGFMQKSTDELQAKHDESAEEGKKLQAKVDELSDPTSDVVQAMIQERSDLETVAKQVEVKTTHEDGKAKDSKTLRIDVISSVHKDFKVGEKSDDYIEARYDSVVEGLETRKDEKSKISVGNFRSDAEKAKGEEKKEPRDAYLEKMDGYHKEEEGK